MKNRLKQICQELEGAFDDENMEKIGYRLEDLKRMVDSLDSSDTTFIARARFLELTAPFREFPKDLSEQLSSDSRYGLNRDQEKTVMNFENYMDVLCEDLAVNLRNMVALAIRSAAQKYEDTFVSETSASLFTEAVIAMIDASKSRAE